MVFTEKILVPEILNCVFVQENETSGTDAASTDAAGQGYEVGTNAAEQRQSGECRHHCRLHFRLAASSPSESNTFLLIGAISVSKNVIRCRGLLLALDRWPVET